jgi:DNA-binding CsgD family transcriptional regulator
VTRFPDAAERRRAPGRRLTDRQTSILELVATGLENKEIAHQLGISEQAVKEHVSTLLRLLYAPNRAALGDAAATRRFLGSATVDPEWLRYLFQDAPMQVAIVEGAEHHFVAVNDAYRTTMGGTDLIGLRYRDAFPDRIESLAYLDKAYATGERVVASGLPRRFIPVGGTEPSDGFVTFVLQPLPGTGGGVGGIAIFSIDVTEEALARQRADQIETEELAILDLLTSGVIVTDAQGVVVRVNRSAREILSLPEKVAPLSPESAGRYDLRDAADGRRVPYEEFPTVRALRGEPSDARVYLARHPRFPRELKLRISALPLRHADGRIRGSVITVLEV